MALHFNRRLYTIQKLWEKFELTGSVADRHRRPRNHIIAPRENNHIVFMHARDRFVPVLRTAAQTNGRNGRPISPQTVRRRFRVAGLRFRRPKKAVILTARHRQVRLQWAHRHLRLSRAEWSNVLFVDETRIKTRTAAGKVRLYRRRGKRYHDDCVAEADRYVGISTRIWAGISMHTQP